MRLLPRRLLPVVVLVRCFSIQDAGSYTWPERVLLLDSVMTVVPIGNSRSTSSRERVVSVFREEVLMYLQQVGLYRFYRAWKKLSCGVLGLLEVSVSAILLPRFAVVVFTAIFPLEYPSADVTFR